jgi:hypothetical protein
MASPYETPIRDVHLEQAVIHAFDQSEDVMADVKSAISQHSKRASRSDQRRFLLELSERFDIVHSYWLQLYRDYQTGLASPRHNVHSFIDVVKNASLEEGYKRGLQENHERAHQDGLNQGYEEGLEDGLGQDPQPLKYSAFGFVSCAILVGFLKYYHVI